MMPSRDAFWDSSPSPPDIRRKVEEPEDQGDRPSDGPPSSADVTTGLEERGLIGRFNEAATVLSPVTPCFA